MKKWYLLIFLGLIVLIVVGCEARAKPERELVALPTVVEPTQTPRVEIVKETVVVEVEKVVEKVVEVVVTATPVVTPTPDKVDLLSTVVAQLIEKQMTPQATVVVQGVEEVPASKVTILSVTPITTTVSLSITNTLTVTDTGWVMEYGENVPVTLKDLLVISKPDVNLWKVFPNVTVTDTVSGKVYSSTNGVEYGMAESVFCQYSQTCDIVVAARHYRLITGDYNIVGIDKCGFEQDGMGCALMIVNVGEVTVNFRKQMVDAGFTVTGRYWNGDKLDQAIWSVMSHAAYSMLNVSGDSTNAGANCSVPGGCKKVRLTFVVVSGDEVLMKGTTVVSK